MSLARRLAVPALVSLAAVACTVPYATDDDPGESSDALRRSCRWTKCPTDAGTSPADAGTTTTDAGTTTSSSDAGTTTAPGTRNPRQQPFASTSIWNMPIGSGAVYVPAGLKATPGGNTYAPMPQVDDERLVLHPEAPLTAVSYSSAGWNTGADRCSPTGGTLFSAPIPTSYVVGNSQQNNSAAFLLADGRTIVQSQPLARCSAGGPATSLVSFPPVDLYGDGRIGAHGGSGLSAIGGSLRLGELRPGVAAPRHALKINVYAAEALFKCTVKADCFRWPAGNADGYAVGHYGTTSNNQNTAMKMGALLAIPASQDIGALGLETEPGRQLAWTLQNYGTYIVDDTWGAAVAINAENGPDGSFRTQFKADWNLDLEQRVNSNTPWSRDMQRLVTALWVVDNNTSTSIGGGGTPRQPLAPAIAP